MSSASLHPLSAKRPSRWMCPLARSALRLPLPLLRLPLPLLRLPLPLLRLPLPLPSWFIFTLALVTPKHSITDESISRSISSELQLPSRSQTVSVKVWIQTPTSSVVSSASLPSTLPSSSVHS